MFPGAWLDTQPDKPALILADTGQTLSFRELEDRSLRLANHLRERGLQPGDVIAVVAENRPEVVEAFWAAQRTGCYATLINWHLTPPETAHIIEDCGASAIIISTGLPQAAEIAGVCENIPTRIMLDPLPAGASPIGASPTTASGAGSADPATASGTGSTQATDASGTAGALPGFARYEEVLAAASDVRPDYEPQGGDLLYSSGTTGTPKGIKPSIAQSPVDAGDVIVIKLFSALYGFDSESVYLSPAPLYHAAPIRFVMTAQAMGGTAVIMSRFDAEESLALIERYRVTHSQWVPTMFVRMLRLPAEVRERYDVSSMKVAIHAAAPCPAEVKQQMIDWWGPVIYEYYASTEGAGVSVIDSHEALEKPGSVGKAVHGIPHICDELGNELPVGQTGLLYFEHPELPFEYHNDQAKTASAQHPQHPNWVTAGDLASIDADGYLYLADRQSSLIISGGVNIYPQEIENVLALHPAVADFAVAGQPDEELGQIAVGYVLPADPQTDPEALIAELREWLAPRLARFKIPRKFIVVDEMPRSPTGKLVKRHLPAPLA